MDALQTREAEIFQTLKKLGRIDFVLIGGYAANSYALPRFSVDCDVVIRKDDVGELSELLKQADYKLIVNSKLIQYSGEFLRFEKQINENMAASVDILIDKVHDRQSGVTFDASWMFKNSAKMEIRGKTIVEKVIVKVITADALFVMKFISARTTDVRDIFMMADSVKDFEWIREEVNRKVNFTDQYKKIISKITQKQFKNNLQGVYGYIDEKVFQRHVQLILSLTK